MRYIDLTLDLERLDGVGSPFGRLPAGQTYRRTRPGARPTDLRFEATSALSGALEALHRGRASPLALAEGGDALRQFLLPGGWAEDEERIAAALARGQQVRLTVRSGAIEILGLPWELLPLGERGLALGRMAGVLIRAAWTGAAPTPRARLPPPEGGRLAIGGSSAGGNVPFDEISSAIRGACTWRGIPLSLDEDRWRELSLRELGARLAREATPALLHLVAHGALAAGAGALAMRADGSEATAWVDGAALGAVIGPWTHTLRAVVLSACHSGEAGGGALGGVGLALHRAGVEAVIASRFPLSVQAATTFARAFYDALLGELCTVEEAFVVGRDALGADPTTTDWASLQLLAHPGRGCRPVVVRPFRGLLGYGPLHRGLYFGREREGRQLQDRVARAKSGELPAFQAVIGASGSGKSSLIKADLLPALAAQGWEILEIRPGLLPWARLNPLLQTLLATAPPERGGLVLVDQLEDLFVALPQPHDQAWFIQALWRLARRGRVVLVVLRVDALGRCGAIQVQDGLGLDAVLYEERHRLFLAQLSSAELRAVIEGPAHRVGLQFEPGLTEALLADVAGLDAALPLLACTLDALWRERRDDTLCHDAYRALGGVEGALARAAEQALAELDPAVRTAAERLLLSLVALDAGGGGRRLVPLDELRPREGAAAAIFDRALSALLSARLVIGEVADASARVMLTLAHHALLTRWPALAARAAAERDTLLALRELQRWASDWQSHRADADGGEPYLLTGSRLGYAVELIRRNAHEPGTALVALIEASRASEEAAQRRALAEAEAREQAARRAQDAALLATARAIQNDDPTRALMVLREVRGRAPGAGWVQSALSLLSCPHYLSALDLNEDLIDLSLAFDPLSPTVALPRGDRVQMLGLDGSERDPFVGADGALTVAGFSPDGAWLVAGGVDGTLWRWSREGGPPRALRGHEGAIHHLAFQPDGSRFVSGSEDGSARVWSASGAPLHALHCPSAVRRVAIHPRGEAVATVGDDPAVRVWRLSPRPVPDRLGRCDGDLRCAAFRPDGRALLTGSTDGAVRIWAGPGAAPVVLTGHSGEVLSARYRPDAGAIISAGADRCIRLWGAGGEPGRVLRGARGAVLFAGFTADGQSIWSAERGGVLRRWGRGDEEGAGGAPRVYGIVGERLAAAELSATEDRLLLAGEGGRVRLLSTSTGHTLPGGAADLNPGGAPQTDAEAQVLRHAHLSPTGDQAIILFDRASLSWTPGAPGRPLVDRDVRVHAAAWRPGSAGFAVADARDGVLCSLPAEIRLAGHSNLVLDLRWSADGRRLLSRGADRRVCVWEPEQGRLLVAVQREGAAPVEADLTEDGRHLVVIDADGQIRATELTEAGPVTRSLGRIATRPVALVACVARRCVVVLDEEGAISAWRLDGAGPLDRARLEARGAATLRAQPGGAQILACMRSGQAWLWAPAENVVPLLLPCRARVRSARFSPSGSAVILACDDGRARIWPVTAPGLRAALGQATSVTLSELERAALLGEPMDSSTRAG